MVLQHIIWPEKPEQVEKELYYHGTPEHTEDGKLRVKAGEKLVFDTYFNCFSGKLWAEHTIVNECEFQFCLSGRGKLFLKTEAGDVVDKVSFCGESNPVIKIEKLENRLYYPEILAEEDTVLKHGKIVTSLVGKDVHLILATCTYNRQEDIKRNLKYLKDRNVLLDGEKVLDHIYVVDNARNLESKELEDETTVVFPNPNTGGAGGFTRGLKEAIKDREMTHVLLMDDDVKMEFEAIVRTKSMLRYMKKEKEGCFIGGAMFRRDVPYTLHAAGEMWNGGSILNPHKNTDMRTLQNVTEVTKTLAQPQVYAGWWYCCIPRTHVEMHGLPIPFFLHCDDVEYSLRSGKSPIFLNGIAVWHEEFDDKRNSVIEYYDTRNRLITNALYMHKQKYRTSAMILAERFLASALRYRYRDIELTLLAVEDFLKGPEWLYSLDSEAYHKRLSDYGYKMQPVEPFEVCDTVRDRSRIQAILRYLLPASGKVTLKVGALVGRYAGKKEVLLVDVKTGKGFCVRKSWAMTLKYLAYTIATCVKLLVCSSRINRSWQLYGK